MTTSLLKSEPLKAGWVRVESDSRVVLLWSFTQVACIERLEARHLGRELPVVVSVRVSNTEYLVRPRWLSEAGIELATQVGIELVKQPLVKLGEQLSVTVLGGAGIEVRPVGKGFPV